ncbi:hypothetical protein SVIOM342S_09397 [Streptomyces violaceorubidus]
MDALASAKAAHSQLRKVFGTSDADAWRGMALTSMLGVNDVTGETFTLADAAVVRAFAEEKGVAWVSMWAAFRDQRCGADASATDALTTWQRRGAGGRGVRYGVRRGRPLGRARGTARSAPPVYQTAAHDGGHARGRALTH